MLESQQIPAHKRYFSAYARKRGSSSAGAYGGRAAARPLPVPGGQEAAPPMDPRFRA